MNDGSDDAPRRVVRGSSIWPLCYHTAANMQARQLAGIIDRKVRHLVVPALPVDFDTRYESRLPVNPDAKPEPIHANTMTIRRALSPEHQQRHLAQLRQASNGALTYMNERIQVAPDGEPDWFHPALTDQPGFWALQFHGFTFLADAVFGSETVADVSTPHELFKRWIRHWSESAETRIGTHGYLRRAWTPHAVSLRLLNWCRYYAWCQEREGESNFLQELGQLIWKNALFLERHIEHDIGGNHLIENASALVMAGTLFRTHEAGARWLDTGLDVLELASDQFLPDGGHFEHSPMYHGIALSRYLTVLDLLQERGAAWPTAIERAAKRATRFLFAIRPPDGRMPLMNDSVYGEGLPLDDCLAYAESVGIEPSVGTTQDELPDSGYYWLGAGDDRLLVDGGRFGPPHLPAHSHNDLFSILLWVDGTQLIADTGTYHYAPTARRQYARSVRGHNTVQVGSAEPVDIGGRYLAGKRVKPQVQYSTTDGRARFEGSYRKHSLRHEQYRHCRQIVAEDDWWLIRDSVTDTASDVAKSRLHFHPQVRLRRQDTGDGFVLSVDDTPLAYLLPVGFNTVVRGTSPYFPEFGIEQTRPSLRCDFSPGDGSTGILLSKRPCSRSQYHELRAAVPTA